MRELTLGSLFDGSGGFPFGGLLCGIRPVWAAEIEPFPIRVTRKRMPFIRHLGDVSRIDGGVERTGRYHHFRLALHRPVGCGKARGTVGFAVRPIS